MLTFQEIIRRISKYWEEQGCITHQGYDLEVGAGTFNPATFLRCLGPEPYNGAYIEPCRRPTDGRYGENPNRLQHYFQFQAILKPSPENMQELYLKSLEAIGFNLSEHDIRFVHDDWESPTLGASGLGWEVWMDGMEVTQFTYFQNFGGFQLKPITGELTYGIERLAMYLQGVDSVYDLMWSDTLKYGDLYHQNEVEWSRYNFEHSTAKMWEKHFDDYESEAKKAILANLPIPAYDFVMKASHAFNMLDARGVISVTERARYIARVRDLACAVASSYLQSREKQGFPLLPKEAEKETSKKADPIPEILLTFSESDSRKFLLEIGSEELPASFVPIGQKSLERLITALLRKEKIPFNSIKTYGTPRRLAIEIDGLAKGKPAEKKERRGPSVEKAFDENGEPKPAATGFFRSIGQEPVHLSSIKEKKHPNIQVKDDYLYATVEIPSVATATLLAENLPDIIQQIDFPKKMRWGSSEITYARPLRWFVALFGQDVLPFSLGNLTSSNISYGHPQLSPGPLTIESSDTYLSALKLRKVLVDPHKRENLLTTQLQEIKKKENCKIIDEESVLQQVINLVEWPEACVGTFEEKFLKIPPEVLISEMVEHQKYFPLANSKKELINKFIITADTNSSNKIIEGNQKVLSARLSDGAFLYEKGGSEPLSSYNEKLKKVTFQRGLGSLYDKVLRLQKHAKYLQAELGISSNDQAERAALLSKADLATEMVFEFPELQGTIGKYYALAQSEDKEVASAIEEQWMPKGEKAPLPQTQTGIILSLADKIDNLISCFGMGLIPTSSSDPHALRRQMLGIIKILVNGQYRLPLLQTFSTCLEHFPTEFKEKQEEILSKITGFITNRIKTVFLEYNLNKDEIEASLSGGVEDIYDMFCRVVALHQFRIDGETFPQLLEVYKRAKGQTTKQNHVSFSEKFLEEQAEKELSKTVASGEAEIITLLDKHDYRKAYELIATLQPPLAKLFDEVKILADDKNVRDNRIALLKKVCTLFDKLLDFEKIKK